jgi:hypothetical protein
MGNFSQRMQNDHPTLDSEPNAALQQALSIYAKRRGQPFQPHDSDFI